MFGWGRVGKELEWVLLKLEDQSPHQESQEQEGESIL